MLLEKFSINEGAMHRKEKWNIFQVDDFLSEVSYLGEKYLMENRKMTYVTLQILITSISNLYIFEI